MPKKFRRIAAIFVAAAVFALGGAVYADPAKQVDTDVSAQLVQAKSGILMEQTTGEVLYEYNPDERMQIASVTKTMTMLLIMEALDSGKIQLEDMVTVSEHAASMGGSQVFLEVGEQMSVNDMLKAIAVASGNDAAVAMAEFVCGSEEAFVEKMNERAIELGCQNTHFINCNGLDETADHYSSARDVALISKELLNHSKIFDYTTIWMDSLRNGQFGLSNTNKLIRTYRGANGLKTGSTSTAKYCLSATAERDGMQLIAVVLCAPSTAERFSSATALLDYGFANYAVAKPEDLQVDLPVMPVVGGTAEGVGTKMADEKGFIIKKGNHTKIEKEVKMDESIAAPVTEGQKIGEVVYTIDGAEAARRDIVTTAAVERMTILKRFIRTMDEWVKL